jgi:hypothetical protein
MLKVSSLPVQPKASQLYGGSPAIKPHRLRQMSRVRKLNYKVEMVGHDHEAT